MQSRIIYGAAGSDFDRLATPMVRSALCQNDGSEGCQCLSCRSDLGAHPDYRIFDKESYLVEDIDELLSFSQSPPRIAPRRVVYLKGLHLVSEISQNKILKLLEDNQQFVLVATADSGNGYVLPTIRSRTQRFFVYKDEKDSFEETLSSEPEKDLLYRMTGGYLGLVEKMRDQIDIFKKVEYAFSEKNGLLLFEALSLLKDKDADNYYEKHGDFVPQMFNFMASLAGRDTVLLRVIYEEKAKSLTSWYKKNDFFVSIANVSETLKEVK